PPQPLQQARRRRGRLRQARRGAEAFDRHQTGDAVGVDAGVLESHARAQRVADDGDREEVERLQERGQVEHVVDHRVGAAHRPGGVAVPAQIGGDEVEVAAQVGRHPVPAPAVVAPAVQEEEGPPLRVAPVDVVERQALRVEVVRRRPEHLDVLGHACGLPRRRGFAESRAPVAGSPAMAGALDGVRVLELGIWVAVPSAGAVLADWGARVVKIEPPEGDPLRGLAATGLVPYPLGEPEGPPPTQRPGMGDHLTGLGLAGAIAAALFARERSGVGQEIGMSLFQSGMWMLATDIQAAITTGYCHTPGGRRAAPNPLFNFYRTGDGRWLPLVILQPDRHWRTFCRAVGPEDLVDDPRFASPPLRFQ